MIALLHGTLQSRDGDDVVVLTDGGVGYAVSVPLGTLERLPAAGARVTLHTELVVREDGWALFGFDAPQERDVFRRLLSASGVGPRLALAILSTLGAARAVQAVKAKDLAVLGSVPGIGRKKAERLALELQDRLDDVALPAAAAAVRAGPAEDAVRALLRLGYAPALADDAVRAVLAADGAADAAAIIRGALQQLAAAKGGR